MAFTAVAAIFVCLQAAQMTTLRLSQQHPVFLKLGSANAQVEDLPIVISALQRLEPKMTHMESSMKDLYQELVNVSKHDFWDEGALIKLELTSEHAYWHQRQELELARSPHFAGLEANWPCLWGEEVIGGEPSHGTKWMCGARFLRKPCVLYSFSYGMRGQNPFQKGQSNLGDCQIHIHDPTLDQSKDGLYHVHKIGLGSGDGPLELTPATKHLVQLQGMPARTLMTAMKEHGHSHIDVLVIDIEGLEYEVLAKLNATGWPSIGQLLMTVHVQGSGSFRKQLLEVIAQVESAGFRLFRKALQITAPDACIEYAFMQKGWRPEIKAYHMTSMT